MAYRSLDKVYIKTDIIKEEDKNLGFKNHKLLHRMTLGPGCSSGQLKAQQSTDPIRIRFKNDQDMIELLKNKDLSEIDDHVLIYDYSLYRKEKLRIFYDWLMKEYLIKSDLKPTFVTQATTLIDLMSAPQLFNGEFAVKDSFHILAQRGPNGLIYMRSTDGKNTVRRQYLRPNVRRKWDFQSHSRLEFMKLLNYHEDDIDFNRVVMSEYQKTFDVIEEELGNNRLIVLSEVDAIDQDDNPVKVRINTIKNDFSEVFKKIFTYEHKMFVLWCHAKIRNHGKQIIGWIKGKDIEEDRNVFRFSDPILESVQVLDFSDNQAIHEHIKKKTGHESFGRDDNPEPWQELDSYAFLNRFLDFVADYVSRPSNNGQVFSFRFKKEWLLRAHEFCVMVPEKSEVSCIYD